MSGDQLQSGAAWPGAQHGEVVGPSGRRCYMPVVAGPIVGVTDRTVRNWVREDKHAILKRDPNTATKPQFFLLAETVEELARSRGRWPPPGERLPDESNVSAWHELFERQGRDLEAARSAGTAAEARVQELGEEVRDLRRERKRLQADLRDLSVAAARLSAIEERRHAQPE